MTTEKDFGIIVRSPGGPEALEWSELELSPPARGEVLIAQRAIGVNFIDTYFRKGAYPWPMTPLIPGGEAAGIVEVLGEGVTDFKPGDRVAYTLPIGAYRTREAARCTPLGRRCSITSRLATIYPSARRNCLPRWLRERCSRRSGSACRCAMLRTRTASSKGERPPVRRSCCPD